MGLKKCILVVLVFAAFLIANSLYSAPLSLSGKVNILSLNVKNYGSNRWQNTKPFDRKNSLYNFLNPYYKTHHIFAFQEVVDVKKFKKEVIRHKLFCKSYDSKWPSHQFLVLCARRSFKISKVDWDNNYTIEEPSLGKWNWKPVLHAKVTDRSGNSVYVANVHFKSNPEHFESRELQLNKMLTYFEEENNYPSIVVGDWNTYEEETHFGNNQEITLFESIFQSYKDSYNRANIGGVPTYYRTGRRFDHMWYDSDVWAHKSFDVAGPCKPPLERGDKADFKKKVSDHCLVSFEMESLVN